MIDWMYWEVDGKKTNSKGQALLWSNGDLNKIKFYFCDNEWSDEDFLLEPTESFEQLAFARCEYLRNRYNWLCLWLSSGYDSVTVLEYFKLSGNKLDEIICYRRGPINDNEYTTSLRMAEEYKKDYNPKCKITFLPIGFDHMDNIYNKLKSDWIYQPGLHLRFTKTAPVWQVHHHDDVLYTLGEGISRGDITGWEKPKVLLENGKWYSWLLDNNTYDAGCSERLIGFFTHKDAFKLYLKQHYMIIKWYESLANLSEDLVHRVQGHNFLYYESNLACGRIPVGNEYSVHGRGKELFKQQVDSPDSVSYLDHFRGSKSIEYFLDGIRAIKEKFPHWNINDNFDKMSILTSRKRFLKNRTSHEPTRFL